MTVWRTARIKRDNLKPGRRWNCFRIAHPDCVPLPGEYNGTLMFLAPGTKLGPYQIQSLLGAGGMGEVYRARDTRLDRTVAIKILPAHLGANTLGHASTQILPTYVKPLDENTRVLIEALDSARLSHKGPQESVN
jgi:serine/threonine protein kinase